MQKRNTLQKKIIRETVGSLYHPTAEDVYDTIKSNGYHFSLTTVYRNLNLMVDGGELTKIIYNNVIRFDTRINKHYHFRCKICGGIVDLSEKLYDSELNGRISEKIGMEVEKHEIEFIGICNDCKPK